MTLNFSAIITVDAKDKTKAIYDSVNTDNEFYPENPVKTEIKFNEKISISVESEHLPHLINYVITTNASLASRTTNEITTISTKSPIYHDSETTS
jgi:KEOPS complex subunit Pcc1